MGKLYTQIKFTFDIDTIAIKPNSKRSLSAEQFIFGMYHVDKLYISIAYQRCVVCLRMQFYVSQRRHRNKKRCSSKNI